MVRARRLLVAAAVVSVLGSAACSTERDVPSPAPVASRQPAECPRDARRLGLVPGQPGAEGGTLPAGFVGVEAIQCVDLDWASVERRHDVEERVAPVTADLVAAVQLPDREDEDAACPAMAETPIHLLLVSPDRSAIHVRLPEDPCGNPRREVAAALGALAFTVRDRFVVDVPT